MEASDLLSDTFEVLSSKEIKLLAMRSKPDKDLLMEEDDMALANVVMEEAQKKLISQVSVCPKWAWSHAEIRGGLARMLTLLSAVALVHPGSDYSPSVFPVTASCEREPVPLTCLAVPGHLSLPLSKSNYSPLLPPVSPAFPTVFCCGEGGPALPPSGVQYAGHVPFSQRV